MSTSKSSIKPIFGGSALRSRFPSHALTKDIFSRLEAGGCDTIDLTHDWPGSEEWVGQTGGGGGRFVINSKTPGGIKPGESTRAGILQHAREIVADARIEKMDVYIIHAPDSTLDLADMLAGINDAYKSGLFARFGLSNFTAVQVEEVYALCKEKEYPLPTVYEGNYNAVARLPEKVLLPTLRRLGIAFYAYSPMAGGLLTKTPAQLTEGGSGAGRFDKSSEGPVGRMYNALYNKPAYLKALEMWEAAATEAGCSRAELAYRWVGCDSALSNDQGDALEFGVSKAEHVDEILGWLKKGSVGAEACKIIDEIWKVVEHEAPLDNYNSFFKDSGIVI